MAATVLRSINKTGFYILFPLVLMLKMLKINICVFVIWRVICTILLMFYFIKKQQFSETAVGRGTELRQCWSFSLPAVYLFIYLFLPLKVPFTNCFSSQVEKILSLFCLETKQLGKDHFEWLEVKRIKNLFPLLLTHF